LPYLGPFVSVGHRINKHFIFSERDSLCVPCRLNSVKLIYVFEIYLKKN
jgi:hypothetical protein